MSKQENHNPYEKWYSISATEDHISCPRRRWLKKTCKLPVQQSAPTIIGDIGHACNERFLMADDRGMDATGRPVNLYPEGWRTMKSRFGKDDTLHSITEEEGVLIKTLIQKSITEGYLIREPGRQVELEFGHIVHKEGKYSIKLIGFIDLENPNEVLDHKFVKNMNYAMSTKKGAERDIRTSIQMTTYAMSKYLRGHKGNMFLSLLYHIKDYSNPAIKKRSIEITEFEVRQFFNNYTLPHMKKMLSVDIKYPKSRVLDFLLVPGPDDPASECNRHYGKPCPFIGVCTGHFTVQQYLTTFGMDINDLINSNNQEGSSVMSNALTDLCKKEIAGLAAGVDAVKTVGQGIAGAGAAIGAAGAEVMAESVAGTAPAATGLAALGLGGATAEPVAEVDVAITPAAEIAPGMTVQVVEPVVESVAPAVSQQRAPWFFDYLGQGCTACNGNAVQGYTVGMSPCIVCDARNNLNNLHTSDHYDAATGGNGVMAFTLKHEFAGAQVGQVTAPETVVQAVAEPAVKETVVLAEAPVVADKVVATEGFKQSPAKSEIISQVDNVLENLVGGGASTTRLPEQSETPEQKPACKDGFVMMIGCSIIKGGVDATRQADHILSDVICDIVVSAGKPIAEIEHFTLLQAIDACIPDIVVSLKKYGNTVICFPCTKGSAMDRLIEGLRIHAHTVIAPIGI